MSNGLAVIDGHNSLALQQVGTGLFKSGMFPNAKNEYGAFAIVQYGSELGIGPMMSLKNINIISGQIAVNGQLMLSLAMRAGVTFKVIREDDTGCSIEFKRGENVYTATFDKKDAEAAGLTGKDNWKKYPKDMYYWRCVAKGVRRVAPDAVMGAYTPDEITEGKVIDCVDVVADVPGNVPVPEPDKNQVMQKEIANWLCEIYDGVEGMERELATMSSFTNKEGKTIKGKTSPFDLGVKENAKGQSQTSITHAKVKEMYGKWKQGMEAANDTDE